MLETLLRNNFFYVSVESTFLSLLYMCTTLLVNEWNYHQSASPIQSFMNSWNYHPHPLATKKAWSSEWDVFLLCNRGFEIQMSKQIELTGDKLSN